MFQEKFRCLVSAAVLALSWPLSSEAAVVQLDSNALQINGNVFSDDHSNGLVPGQAGDGFPYAVTGAFPSGAESGGLLTMNSSGGVLSNNALGQTRQSLVVTALTGLTDTSNAFTLDRGDRFSLTSIFNIAIPSGPLTNGYGIRFRDGALGGAAASLLVELYVMYNEVLGGNVIRFSTQDFIAHTITTLGFVDLVVPSGMDQIELQISHAANSDSFFGAYAFGSGGIFDPMTQFATAGQLDSTFYRGQLIAFSAVPEPTGVMLLGLAMACLICSQRRRLASTGDAMA